MTKSKHMKGKLYVIYHTVCRVCRNAHSKCTCGFHFQLVVQWHKCHILVADIGCMYACGWLFVNHKAHCKGVKILYIFFASVLKNIVEMNNCSPHVRHSLKQASQFATRLKKLIRYVNQCDQDKRPIPLRVHSESCVLFQKVHTWKTQNMNFATPRPLQFTPHTQTR